jgi:hypothetical protein
LILDEHVVDLLPDLVGYSDWGQKSQQKNITACHVTKVALEHVAVTGIPVADGLSFQFAARLQSTARPVALLYGFQLFLDVLRRTVLAYAAGGSFLAGELFDEMVPFDRMGGACHLHHRLRGRSSFNSARDQPVSHQLPIPLQESNPQPHTGQEIAARCSKSTCM